MNVMLLSYLFVNQLKLKTKWACVTCGWVELLFLNQMLDLLGGPILMQELFGSIPSEKGEVFTAQPLVAACSLSTECDNKNKHAVEERIKP